MPYISPGLRSVLRQENEKPKTPGALNYELTRLMLVYLKTKGLSWQTLNDISGAMTESLAEFRRRHIVPFEKDAIRRNGDLAI
jgi:hypothetical protein